jgi:hypothetical protein
MEAMTHFFDSAKGGKLTYKDTGPLTKKRMQTVGPLIYPGGAGPFRPNTLALDTNPAA